MRRPLLALLLVVVASPASAATFYVAKTGSDANTCTAAQSLSTPKLTIASGLTCLTAAGAILQIRTGVYAEQLTGANIPANGTSWANPITIQAYPGDIVTLRPVTTQGNVGRFSSASRDFYLVLDHLIFDGITTGGNAGAAVFYCGDNNSHLRVSNSEIANGDGNGVLCGGTGHEFVNDTVHTNGRYTGYTNSNGMYMATDSTIIVGGAYYDNECYGVRFYDSSGSLFANDNTVSGARIYSNGQGRGLSGASVCGSGGGGIVLGDVNNLAKNNVIYNNYWGVQITTEKSASVQWYNNTITANDYGADMTNAGASTAFRNNIVYANINLQLYQMGSVVQSNNLQTTPSFVNAAGNDYHIPTGSAAKDAGVTLAAVTDDFDGLTRPKGSAYDIGAYEFDTPPSALLSTNRSLDWSVAGTTIQTRSTICTTLQPPSSSSAINAAIAACGAGQVVKLAAGTFTINGGLNISRNDVTLRGSGPTQTTLALQSYDSCNGQGAGICVTGSGTVPFPPDSPRNLANWTAGFAKGATAITLSSVTNLQVGSTIILDQLDDSTPDFNGIANCANRNGAQATWCSGEGANNLSMDSQRVQHETHKVTAIAGNVVTITPALAWPNWSLSKTPHAWWGSSLPVTGVGIEDLKLDATNEGCGAFFSSCGGILFFYAADSWVKNVEVFKMAISQMKLYESRNITIRDSYLRTSKSLGSTAYGLLLFYSSYNLIENNIFQDIVAGALLHGVGNVVGYNYMLDNTYNPSGAPFPPGNSQMQAGMYHHNGGAGYELWEGNDANSFKADAIHGTSNLTTVFRNRLTGYENLKDQHTNPVFVYAWNRYFNFVGNVLGTSTYHTTSGTYASSFNSSAIYRFGETPNYCPWAGSSGGGCTVTGGFTDARVAATSMRWGNYDTVHAANQFVSAEVPSGDANYPNPVPANQTLPTSFYRSATAPTWWATPWGTPGYPAIGPDVTGGSIAGLAGHAQKIPARLCYENMSHTTTGSTTGTIQLISNFNADVCYPTTGSPTDTTPPVVTITTNSGTNFTVTDPLLTTLAGGAVDDIQVVFDCRWTNAANAGAGTAPGAFSWSVASIPLALGPNLITVYCHDAANNEGNDTITVTLDQPPPSGPFYRLRIGG